MTFGPQGGSFFRPCHPIRAASGDSRKQKPKIAAQTITQNATMLTAKETIGLPVSSQNKRKVNMIKRFIAVCAVLCLSLVAHGATQPILQPYQTFLNPNAAGLPCAGCSLYSYAAGTTTPLATFTDSTGGTSHTNPIILDTGGGSQIWLGASPYKFVLKDTGGSTVWTADNVAPVASISSLSAYLPLAGGTLTGAIQIGHYKVLPGGTQTAGTLQAAITALGANSTIVLPANYSETITAAVSIALNNVRVECQPGAAIISSGAAQAFNISGNSDEVGFCSISGATAQGFMVTGSGVYIHDNSLTNAGNTQPGAGTAAGIELETSGPIDAWIVRNTITGGGNNTGGVNFCANIVANYTTNGSNNGTNRLHIIGNHIFGNTSPDNIFLFNVSDTEVKGNVIDGNNKIGSSNLASGYGIMLYNTAPATAGNLRNIVAQNFVSNTAGTGIYMQGDSYFTVENNVLTNTVQQQLDTTLAVGAIAVAAGNTSSPIAIGGVISGNTIHTSGKSGIEATYSSGLVVSNNTMDGVAKNGIWFVTGPVQTSPVIVGNYISATANGVVIQGTPNAIVKNNFTTGFTASGVSDDSADCAIDGNTITGNTGSAGYPLFVNGNYCTVNGNHVYNITTAPSNAVRIGGTGVRFQGNIIDVSGITIAVLLSSATNATVESNTISHASGSSYAIVDQAGSTGDTIRNNWISGGTSPGYQLAGTAGIEYGDVFAGSIAAVHGTSHFFQLSDGTGTSGNCAKYDANGNMTDSGFTCPTGSTQYQVAASVCTPTASTDSGCTGTITLPVAFSDATYTVQATPSSSAGAFMNFTITGKVAASFTYALSCSFNCASYGTLAVDVVTHHN